MDEAAEVTGVCCTRCAEPLTYHCEDSPTCTWLECRTRDCTAHLFDTGRGVLQLRGGEVVGWGE